MNWAKMAADLDSHPKVRRAGRDGREVFLFALRRNASMDLGGRIPVIHLEPWYVADQLLMTEAEAVSGLSRAVTAGLLHRDGDFIVIAGWDDEWAKRPLTEAERKQRQRAKSRSSDKESGHVTEVSGQVRDSPESHVSEERRIEEKRVEENITAPPAEGGLSNLLDKLQEHTGDVGVARALEPKKRTPREPSGPHQQAIAEFDAYYQRAHDGAKPTWNATQGKRMKQLLDRHGLHEIVRRIAVLEQTPPRFPPTPWDFSTFALHFDKVATPPRDAQSGLQAVLAIANGEAP